MPWTNSFTNKSLELILFITEHCNFRCKYCYEDFMLGNMHSDVITGVKKLISNRIGGLDTLSLSFFGGEPLVNKEAIIELSKWTLDLCQQKGVACLFSITTNGYLLNKNTFTELIKCGISDYQITIDGDQQVHDKFRPTVNGKPTFQKIYSNLLMMSKRNLDFKCLIRLNISDLNFNAVKSFINVYSSPFSNDDRFSFHFHPIFGMKDLRLLDEKYLDELVVLAKEKGIKSEVPSESVVCYAALANSFVIRADGTIQKCTVYLDKDVNKLGLIQKNGHLTIDEEKYKKWISAYDKGCPLRSVQDL